MEHGADAATIEGSGDHSMTRPLAAALALTLALVSCRTVDDPWAEEKRAARREASQPPPELPPPTSMVPRLPTPEEVPVPEFTPLDLASSASIQNRRREISAYRTRLKEQRIEFSWLPIAMQKRPPAWVNQGPWKAVDGTTTFVTAAGAAKQYGNASLAFEGAKAKAQEAIVAASGRAQSKAVSRKLPNGTVLNGTQTEGVLRDVFVLETYLDEANPPLLHVLVTGVVFNRE
jgi:hypothetical protein